jgi:hypothetical protein
MAQKKIDDLQLRSSFDETCSLPVVDPTQTWRSTGQQVLDFISAKFPNPAITTKTTTYTALLTDRTILADATAGAWTLSLPAAATCTGKLYTIKRIDATPANALTIDPNGAELIEGVTTIALYMKGETVVIQSTGTAWVVLEWRGLAPQTVYIRDVKAAGTDGGAANTTTFTDRVLNTLDNQNGYPWVALASNHFTLQPGKYDIEGHAPFRNVNSVQIAIYNITDSTYDIPGTSEYNQNTNNVTNTSRVCGQLNITSAKVYALRYRAAANTGTADLGVGAGFGISNVFAVLRITRTG